MSAAVSDRELLELAAKAAGYALPGQMIDVGWSPLTDDGDALRLAVVLGVIIGTYKNCSTVDLLSPNRLIETVTVWHHETENDSHAATRCAIVRAAAEIGKVMP